ncbi:hypothetical protein D3C71_1951800 [compost metagenome]
MMTMCELGYARYERFRDSLQLNADYELKLREFIHENVDMEHELSLRIRVAPMRKAMA